MCHLFLCRGFQVEPSVLSHENIWTLTLYFLHLATQFVEDNTIWAYLSKFNATCESLFWVAILDVVRSDIVVYAIVISWVRASIYQLIPSFDSPFILCYTEGYCFFLSYNHHQLVVVAFLIYSMTASLCSDAIFVNSFAKYLIFVLDSVFAHVCLSDPLF